MKQSSNKKTSGIKRVVDVIEWALVLLAAGLAVYVMVNASQGKAVKLFGNSLLYIVTGSMEPTVSPGEYIYIKDVEISDLKEGDIVAYYSEDPEIAGKLVLHRIVNIHPDGTYQTMGDANPIPDKLPVRADQIAGRFTGRARLFNWLASFVSPRKLLLLAVVIPLFLLSIYEVGTIANIFIAGKNDESDGDSEESADGEEGSNAGILSSFIEKRNKKGESREEAIERIRREAIEAYIAEHNGEANHSEMQEPEENLDPEVREGLKAVPELNEQETEKASEVEISEVESSEENSDLKETEEKTEGSEPDADTKETDDNDPTEQEGVIDQNESEKTEDQ